MASTPSGTANDTNKIINAWSTLAPDATFAGITLAQYKAKVQPSFDARAQIDNLDAQLTAAKDNRDQADAVTTATNQLW
jgi:hypothetical protein